MLKNLSKYGEWTPVFLRIALGLILIVHGYDKLFSSGVASFTSFLANIGFPAAMLFAWVVSIVEFFGGIFILVGLFTRIVSLFIVIQFIVILILKIFKFSTPFVDFKTGVGGFQLDLIILAVALALLIRGSGKKWSLEKTVLKKEF